MEFEDWLKEHGIDPEELDEGREAELKAAFEAGDEPPEPESEKTEPEPEPEPAPAGAPKKAQAASRSRGSSHAVRAVAQARKQAESAIRQNKRVLGPAVRALGDDAQARSASCASSLTTSSSSNLFQQRTSTQQRTD